MVEQCRWNKVGGTLRWNSGTVLVEQCGGTVEQCWRDSVVEQWNSVGGIGEQCWWNSGTVMVKQCRWNSDSRTVKQCLWNSVVEQWNSVDGTVWWNTVGGTVEQ